MNNLSKLIGASAIAYGVLLCTEAVSEVIIEETH